MRLPVPKRVQERLAPLVERAQAFLKEWEWTWTRAVVASMGLAVVTLIFTVIIPSWWLYFADQTLRWRTFWTLKLRDAIAAGIIVVSFATILGVAYLLQVQRHKLRGTGAEHRTGGYR
jgi:type II secretory pathway component PulF